MVKRTKARTQQLVNSLIGAVEGGTGYWAYSDNYVWGSDNGIGEVGEGEYASVTLQDMESDERYDVTIDTIELGWDRIMNGEVEVAPYIKQYLIDDNSDSDSDDCLVQAGIFGEIIYS
jgi:hypothetical protein